MYPHAMTDNSMLDDFYNCIEKLRKEHMLIIVEGKNDKKALQHFDLENIVTLATPLYKILEMMWKEKVVILTDFDRKGKQLYKKIKSLCSQRGIYIDDTLRLLLLKHKLSHVEGLATFIKNKEEKSSIGRLNN